MASTRAALLEAGRAMFAAQSYDDIPAEELVRTAGLTRGALYHHFDGKRGLFEAVFEELETAAAQQIEQAMTAQSAPWDRARAGAVAFLEACTDPTFRHVVLLQGPLALGWERWRELDRSHLGGVLDDAVAALASAAAQPQRRTDLVTALIYGALTELSLAVADATDTATAAEEAIALAEDLLRGLVSRGA